MMLRQCKLSRPGARGRIEDVFWIDNDLAKVGKKVVDEENTVWTIEAIYNAKDIKDLNAYYDQWREFEKKLEPHR